MRQKVPVVNAFVFSFRDGMAFARVVDSVAPGVLDMPALEEVKHK